jgi:hypothetical protein
MALVTCKDMDKWYEKSNQSVERIDYINVVQHGRYAKDHDIWVLKESNLDHIKKSVEYWVKMAQEPHLEIQEKWAKSEKSLTKIYWAMRDIDLPEFNTPNDFVDLRAIVKSLAEQDSSWAAEITKVADMVTGQV